MLILTVFLTLLCSSLADARKALVDSSEALTRCLNQPYCNNAALDIDETTFQPTVKASPHGVVVLNLAVKSNRPLTFPVHVENYSVTWKITRPGDKCIWKITSEGIGAVVFKEIPGSPTELPLFCNVAVGGDVNISVRTEGTDNYVDFTGECDTKPSPGKLSACAYARPDSDSIPGWDIWTISVSATTSDPRASIALRDAYVVHDAPEPQAAPQCGTACLECVRSMLTPNSN